MLYFSLKLEEERKTSGEKVGPEATLQREEKSPKGRKKRFCVLGLLYAFKQSERKRNKEKAGGSSE